MYDNKAVTINFSKFKLALGLIGSTIFVSGGLFLIVVAPLRLAIDEALTTDPVIYFIVGLANILFFGYAGLFFIKTLLSSKPAIIINTKGVFDNSNATSIGFIPWEDIEQIKKLKVLNQKFIALILKDPQSYLNREPNFVRRKIMEYNLKYYHSPISISCNFLITNFKELYQLLRKKIEN
ncbi:MAG: STM3941 family protein [Patescibacteria group bacterium]